MSGLRGLCLALAVALAVVAGVVLAGGDSTVLVEPPEAVAETFVRDLVARRHELAMSYVEERSGVSLTTVRLGAEELRARAGDVVPNDVDGRDSVISGSRAEAEVEIRRPGKPPLTIALSLVRTAAGT